MPPLRRLDCVCDSGSLTTAFRLNLTDRAESTRREGFLEFAEIERIYSASAFGTAVKVLTKVRYDQDDNVAQMQ
jgi:hypothetical protein